MAAQSEEDVFKKKRRHFRTQDEKKEAKKERKKAHDSRRISVGSAWDEWERQRAICGGIGHIDFIHHLLAVHESRCNTFIVSTSSSISQNRMSGDISAFTEVVPETPQKKCATNAIPMPDCSPLLEYNYISQQTPSARQQLFPEPNSPEQVPMDTSPDITAHPQTNEGIVTSTPKPGVIPPSCFGDTLEPGDLQSSSDEDEQDDERLADDIEWEEEEEDSGDEDWLNKHPPPRKLQLHMTKEQAIKGKKCIAYSNVLEQLLKAAVGETCKRCDDFIEFTHVKLGTCLVIKWKCPNFASGHSSGTWASQPRMHGMYAANLLVPASLILSGNNYAKVALMAKFLNLNFTSKSMFYRIQEKYVTSAVNTHWERMQNSLLQEMATPAVVAGDGRNDSPGYSSKYCTYSCMDVATNKIVALACIDCRQTQGNSVIMERLGFKRAMEQILPHIKVAEIVTDAHPQIGALIKRDESFKNIAHQHDVWHVCKNLSKKLTAAGKEKGCQDILKWKSSITNHLWFCARECEGNASLLKVLWSACYNHVCNKHEWLDTTSEPKGHCSHPIPLPPDEERAPWIQQGSKAQTLLRNIILDPKFDKKLPFLRNFRHTGQLELFNSLLLMYCPKRIAFTYPIYVMRNQLAALDHNYHANRQYAKNKVTGQDRYRSHYSKGTQKFSVSRVKEPKTYTHIWTLLEEIVNLRELAEGVERLDAKAKRAESDPRNIQPNIAAIPRPSTEELVRLHKSRFAT